MSKEEEKPSINYEIDPNIPTDDSGVELEEEEDYYERDDNEYDDEDDEDEEE